MESIQNINVLDGESDYKALKEKSVNEILQDICLKGYVVERSLVEENWIDFLNYQEDYHMCDGCTGLESCQKVIPGKREILNINGNNVSTTLAPCTYGRELIVRQNILAKILVKNVKDQLVLSSKKDISNVVNKNPQVIGTFIDYLDHPKSTGFIITGKFGIGKSTLAGFMVRNLANAGHTCGYIHFPTFLMDLKSSFNDYGNEDNSMEALREVDYLVIDDLGGENVTAWSRDEVLSAIITYRLQNKKPIIITTDYDQSQLIKLYTLKSNDIRDKMKVERLINSIYSMCKTIQLNV